MLPLEVPAFYTVPMTTKSLPSSRPPCIPHMYDACTTPSPKKRAFSSDESDWVRANRVRHDGPSVLQASIEPLHEPATDEIPIADLLYWLGDVFPIQAPCQCTGCWPRPIFAARPSNRRGHFLYIPLPRYSGLSAKIPVIALPRIEGFN